MRVEILNTGLVSATILFTLASTSQALPDWLRPKSVDIIPRGYSVYENAPIAHGYTYGGYGPAPTLSRSPRPTSATGTSDKSGEEASVSSVSTPSTSNKTPKGFITAASGTRAFLSTTGAFGFSSATPASIITIVEVTSKSTIIVSELSSVDYSSASRMSTSEGVRSGDTGVSETSTSTTSSLGYFVPPPIPSIIRTLETQDSSEFVTTEAPSATEASLISFLYTTTLSIGGDPSENSASQTSRRSGWALLADFSTSTPLPPPSSTGEELLSFNGQTTTVLAFVATSTSPLVGFSNGGSTAPSHGSPTSSSTIAILTPNPTPSSSVASLGTSSSSTSNFQFVTTPEKAISVATTSAVATRGHVSFGCSHNNCLRQFVRSSAIVARFCGTYMTTINTATTDLPVFVSQCSGSPSKISSACFCLTPGPLTFTSAPTLPSSEIPCTDEESAVYTTANVPITTSSVLSTSSWGENPKPTPVEYSESNATLSGPINNSPAPPTITLYLALLSTTEVPLPPTGSAGTEYFSSGRGNFLSSTPSVPPYPLNFTSTSTGIIESSAGGSSIYTTSTIFLTVSVIPTSSLYSSTYPSSVTSESPYPASNTSSTATGTGNFVSNLPTTYPSATGNLTTSLIISVGTIFYTSPATSAPYILTNSSSVTIPTGTGVALSTTVSGGPSSSTGSSSYTLTNTSSTFMPTGTSSIQSSTFSGPLSSPTSLAPYTLLNGTSTNAPTGSVTTQSSALTSNSTVPESSTSQPASLNSTSFSSIHIPHKHDELC